MALSNLTNAEGFGEEILLPESYSNHTQIDASAVSWSAILAGATAAAALSLILLLLGAGLGLSSVSPWGHKGVSASTFGVSTIVWLTVTQILAAGMGGFLAGRLRTKWVGIHIDEVYFRDTAHGFLVWAVASLATAALLTSAIGSIVNGGVQAAANFAGVAATMVDGAVVAGTEVNKSDSAGGIEKPTMAYFIDSLFRKDFNQSSATPLEDITTTTDTAQQASANVVVARIFLNSMSSKMLPPADLTYVSQVVSRQTGLTQDESEKRVTDIYTNIQAKKQSAEIAAKDAADKARKASIYATLWLFVSLLMGAFSASLAATWGGRCRDA